MYGDMYLMFSTAVKQAMYGGLNHKWLYGQVHDDSRLEMVKSILSLFLKS